MKKGITGILSGVLLAAVLAGNILFALQENRNLAIQTFGNTTAEAVDLPVLMYHHILKSPKRWGDYVISPEQFEEDLKYIKAQGYTTVSVEEILDYLEEQKPLPKKPILITFDDGYESTYAYAFPLLQEYQMKAVVSIIGKYTDFYSGNVTKNVSYSHANWTQLKEMVDSGLIEIGNHTYDLHKSGAGERKGIQKLPEESDEAYCRLLTEDVTALNQAISRELGYISDIFAYPFGTFSEECDPLLHELGFQVILICEEKVNHLTPGDYTHSEVLKLCRFNRSSGISSAKMFEKFGG